MDVFATGPVGSPQQHHQVVVRIDDYSVEIGLHYMMISAGRLDFADWGERVRQVKLNNTGRRGVFDYHRLVAAKKALCDQTRRGGIEEAAVEIRRQ